MITLELFNRWQADTSRALVLRSSVLQISSRINYSMYLSLILLGTPAISRYSRGEYCSSFFMSICLLHSEYFFCSCCDSFCYLKNSYPQDWQLSDSASKYFFVCFCFLNSWCHSNRFSWNFIKTKCCGLSLSSAYVGTARVGAVKKLGNENVKIVLRHRLVPSLPSKNQFLAITAKA